MNKKFVIPLCLFAVFLLGISVTIKKLNLYPSITSLVQTQKVSHSALHQIADIPLSGGANRLDYQSIDADTNRLYIAHLGSNLVHVVDLTTQKVIADIPLSSSPYGILAVAELQKVFVGLGGNNEVGVIDEKTNRVVKTIQAGQTPDGIAYDPQNKRIYVSNENGGTVTVIDAVTNEHITDIPIGGSVGNTHYYDKGKSMYTVSGDANILAEIDPLANKVINTYPLQGCNHAHGFFIDSLTHYAFITCDVNNAMLVFDLDTHKIIATDTVGAVPDVLAYDGGLHHLYVAGESGIVSIFSVQKDNVKKIYEGFLAPHAHTIAVDQKTHFVYLPLENINGKPVVRILKPE